MLTKIVLFLLIAVACLLLVFAFEAVHMMVRLRNISYIPDKGKYKQCGWLKQIPKNWNCTDNWDQNDRFAKASLGNQKLELHIYSPYVDIPTPQCAYEFFVSVPYKPSASGIAIPIICKNKKEVFFYADWEQDGYEYQLKGSNVSRSLFLDNLQKIGFNLFK